MAVIHAGRPQHWFASLSVARTTAAEPGQTVEQSRPRSGDATYGCRVKSSAVHPDRLALTSAARSASLARPESIRIHAWSAARLAAPG